MKLHVEPNGPAQTIDAGDGLQVTKLSVSAMDNNVYWLRGTDGPAVLIDAADDAARIREVVDHYDAVVTTHRHWDHIRALADLADGVTTYAGAPDVDAIAAETGVHSQPLDDGDTVPCAGGALEVIRLTGHTPGAIALAWLPADGPAHLFTGDSLFPGGPGRTGSPADFASLMDDLEAKVFARFDDATVVHPGHGDGITLGTERPHLTEWRSRGW